MANYWGKSPLRMQCPHCGEFNKHRVIQTDPDSYHWSDEAVPLFERIASRDLSYRARSKRCTKCGREFESVEMASLYLHALMREVERLSEESRQFRSELESTRTKLTILQGAVDRAARALSRHHTKAHLTGASTWMRRKRRASDLARSLSTQRRVTS